MARPIKENADYFSHDADASSDEKLIFLESRFGLEGYAVYFKMLEFLARANNFEIEFNDLKISIYAKKIGIIEEKFRKIIKECCRDEIKAFILKERKLYSPGLKKRMHSLVIKRKKMREKYKDETISEEEIEDSESEIRVSDSEMTQSKEENSKEEPEELGDDLDNNNQMTLKEIRLLFEGSIGRPATGEFIISDLQTMIDKYKPDNIRFAFSQASKAGATHLNYICKVLQNRKLDDEAKERDEKLLYDPQKLMNKYFDYRDNLHLGHDEAMAMFGKRGDKRYDKLRDYFIENNIISEWLRNEYGSNGNSEKVKQEIETVV